MKSDVHATLAEEVHETELRSPSFFTLFKVIWYSIRHFFRERPGQIIGSAFILIMLWGFQGRLELLTYILPDWRGPGIDIGNRPQMIAGIPWDHELISFWLGAFLLVMVPIIIIKFGFKQPLSDYGLGLPPKGRRLLALWAFIILTLISIPAFWMSLSDPAIAREYPIYKPLSGSREFILYELTYIPFFIAIEFIFRGYLLFGLADIKKDDVKEKNSLPGIFYLNRYAILIPMLSYTAWHLGKPVPELWGTLVWGLAAGAAVYAIRSIWPIVLAHWLLNVFMDASLCNLF